MEENKTEQKLKLYQRHPVMFWGCVAIEALAVLLSVLGAAGGGSNFFRLLSILQLFVIIASLSYINVVLIFMKPKTERAWKRKVRAFEILSGLTGFIMTKTALAIEFSATNADWDTRISVMDKHSPIWLRSIPTLEFLCLVGVAGYLILAFTHAKKTPPLITVLAISALYIGIFECAMWIIQVCAGSFLLIVLPINLIIIAARLLREKAMEFKTEGIERQSGRGGFVGWLNKQLGGERFPIWALVLAFPLLGVAIGILVLLGQRPDDLIKCYTETADWTFSQKIAPPGYPMNHYLCTVAAQGHKKLVKPQRVGIRHGRKTIVNRQLCIANAFEQILEERTPKLHKAVRGFYDAHGFPLSKLIQTKVAADFVYIAMKPLEWFFLVTLYLFTANPEERISRQYRK
ncbi:MAG: hypothetical protein LBU41_02555 [Clostridiales Family XIII bacterium]|jgi:hypothetical protein|nr:hypothetical protein [Clostridiales Family XIII bacterium]